MRNFYQLCPFIALLFIGKEKDKWWKSRHQCFCLFFFFSWLLLKILQTLYSTDCQCINRRKPSRVVRLTFQLLYLLHGDNNIFLWCFTLYKTEYFLAWFAKFYWWLIHMTKEHQWLGNTIKLMFQNQEWHNYIFADCAFRCFWVRFKQNFDVVWMSLIPRFLPSFSSLLL